MIDQGYLFSFTTGLLGGFGHCIGMCGPIVAAYSWQMKRQEISWYVLSVALLYNAGRVTTYSFIGAVMGLTGSFLNSAGRLIGLQYSVSLLAGLIMVLMGLSIVGIGRKSNFLERRTGAVMKLVGGITEGGGAFRYYPLGLLLGFLPCGLSYSIFVGSAGTGGLLKGAAFALCFGLGTIPALLLVGLVASRIGGSLRTAFYRAGGVAVILMGLIFIFRGVRSYVQM